MLEMTDAGKYHRYIVLVSRSQNFFVPNGTPRRNNGSNTIFSGLVNGVPEREKRIRSHDSSLQRLACFLNREAGRVNPAHLPRSNTKNFPIFSINNSIGLNMFGHDPGKFHIFHFPVIRFFFAHHLELVFNVG